MAQTKLEQDSIVPDVVDTAPKDTIIVKYSSGVEVNLGNELAPTEVKDEPSHISWSHDGESFYTLAMVDPDAPSRADPARGQCLHWLVVNIPSNKISEGKTMVEYIGSGPPEGTGLHRYIFLLFKQQGKLEPEEAVTGKTSLAGRLDFSIRDYAKKYNLGQPVAANYYQAQYDDYCPILMAQFSG